MECDDLTDEESDQADDCALEVIAREIINNQNAQIQVMRGLLDSNGYPEENDCQVPMSGSDVTLPTVPTTEVEMDVKEESAVSSEDKTAVVTGVDTSAATDLDNITPTKTPDGSSSVSKGIALAKLVATLLALNFLSTNFGLQF